MKIGVKNEYLVRSLVVATGPCLVDLCLGSDANATYCSTLFWATKHATVWIHDWVTPFEAFHVGFQPSFQQLTGLERIESVPFGGRQQIIIHKSDDGRLPILSKREDIFCAHSYAGCAGRWVPISLFLGIAGGFINTYVLYQNDPQMSSSPIDESLSRTAHWSVGNMSVGNQWGSMPRVPRPSSMVATAEAGDRNK
ncbi:uncharacterized protein EI90DRAFT_3286279 [Cantharellus anzutake]|uniref:uncharacterized protein n=1 Tax=Cantharellus anzutake TaxID=1750568 RepID=UPI001906173F|nr:uncharacterized protein EI90DRAFT_3286279 [Cantharellus anzutake]KAF8339865.1 hypothetical protein EI90DRAFT_3286279 [Cantharellus anzutake]